MDNVAQLEVALSNPSDALTASLARLNGDLLILGAGGKMGPTFARMATSSAGRRRSRSRVIAVSRFTTGGLAGDLTAHGIETISGDLFDADFVRNLPSVDNVLYLVGMKSAQPPTPLALGRPTPTSPAWSPTFFRSRIVALSTGNVYGMIPIDNGRGSVETDLPRPDGEYAMSALGRERVFEHFSREYNTPTTLARLNYATELRYGVLCRSRTKSSPRPSPSRWQWASSTPSGNPTRAT